MPEVEEINFILLLLIWSMCSSGSR